MESFSLLKPFIQIFTILIKNFSNFQEPIQIIYASFSNFLQLSKLKLFMSSMVKNSPKQKRHRRIYSRNVFVVNN